MAADHSIGTPEQLRDPDYTPPLATALPLGIQHVLAMFVSNITPAIIVAGAAGFGFGTPGVFDLIYMIGQLCFNSRREKKVKDGGEEHRVE